MLTLLFFIGMISIFGNMIFFALKATWGLTKILFSVVLLPLLLIVIFIKGLLSIAFPLLIIIGVFSLISNRL